MPARKPPNRYAQVSEADFQAQIVETLRLHGWLVAHFRPALNRSGRWSTPVAADGAGFPDLVAVHARDGDIIAIELKREGAKPTVEQLQWLGGFMAADVDAVCWQPSDVDEAIARIAAPQKRVRRLNR